MYGRSPCPRPSARSGWAQGGRSPPAPRLTGGFERIRLRYSFILLFYSLKRAHTQAAFGTFKVSSNYDDANGRVVAGLNGLGIKLTNAFSDQFTVKVKHAASGDTYEQTWRNQIGRAHV